MKGASAMELEADRRLIALVRQLPALYDAEHERYQDAAWKAAAWRSISVDLGMDAKLCRSRWFNMRDIYRKSVLRTRRQRQRGQRVRVYKYAQDMAFLQKYFVNLAPARRDPDPLAEDTDTGGGDEEASLTFSEAALDAPAERPEFAKVERHSPEPLLEPPTPSASAPAPAPAHPVDVFLACIEPTLKALPPYFLSLAKGEIFAAVQKYELRTLQPGPAEGAAEDGAAGHFR